MNPLDQQPSEQEENPDYDIFASVRPNVVLGKSKSLKEDKEDIFSDVRPRKENFEGDKSEAKKPKENTWGDIISDVFKQGAKETAINTLGTYGDIYQATKSKNEDLIDVNPVQLAPTTNKLRDINESLGGPGEAETGPGRYAGNVGKLYGSGLAFGQVNPLPAIVGGLAGEGVKDLGGGPLLQGAVEIASMVLTPTKWPTLANSVKKGVEDVVNKLKNLGYTEKDITLAVNSASKGKRLGVKANRGSKTEQAFEDFAEHSDDIVAKILESEVPGFEKGAKHIHQLASDAYGQVAEEASKINIKKLDPFIASMESTMKEVKRKIGHNAEAKNFINELTEHTLDIIDNPTAENMMNFFSKLNGLGKWISRSQKDRIISNVKNSIKDTFRAEGKQGAELADKFEKVNAGVKKAYDAEKVSKVINKATTQEGINYNQLNKSFDSKDTVKLFEDVLGKKQTENLQLIAKTGKEVKNFDKSWKITNLLTGTPTSFATQAGYLFYSGSWPAMAALKIGEVGSRLLAEKSLTDPKFQNLFLRGLHAIKSESPKLFRSANEAMQKYLDEEGVELNLTK